MTTAAIYIRGNNEEMQELMCRAYASYNGYKVLYVTRHINDVNLCDVMIVSDISRISRDSIEFVNIVNKLKDKGIKVESCSSEDIVESIFSSIVLQK